jgi:predicted ArsR family transcriptional regulator
VNVLDLIAEPVRLGVVRHLAAHGNASLSELAAAAGVHVNTARPHVQALEDAGLLRSETRPATGPGRPAVAYTLVDGWTLSATNFLGLAELLAAALLRADERCEDLRRLGRQWGQYLAGRPGARDLEVELPSALERLGFDARVGRDVELLACPCPLVAPDRPALVCELAVGVTEGVLAATGSRCRVGGRDHDAARRHCRLRLRPAA